MAEEILEHIVHERRDEFELKNGLTYCRRCGGVVVNDKFPKREIKPCRVVKVSLRAKKRAA